MLTRLSPHHTNIGKRESRQMLTALTRLRGHCSIGPSGVSLQRKARTRLAISLSRTAMRLPSRSPIKEGSWLVPDIGDESSSLPTLRLRIISDAVDCRPARHAHPGEFIRSRHCLGAEDVPGNGL